MHTGGVPHSVVLAGQVQTPAWQLRPPVHTTPHAPQFARSVWVVTQAPAQAVSPEAHVVTHWLCEQTWPAVQAVAQIPQ